MTTSIRTDKLDEQIKKSPELAKVTHYRVEMPDGIVRQLSVEHALELGRSPEGPYVTCQPLFPK
jgi:hypothetical protein